MAFYVAYRIARHGSVTMRPMMQPLSVAVASGTIASMALFTFFWTFSGREGLASILAVNATRIDPSEMSMAQVAGALLDTVRECERTLGAVALLLGAAAIWVEPRHRGLLMLMGAYVAATVAFNLAVFRLPGAGSSYLDSAVPALALLVGPATVRCVQLGATPLRRTLMALTAIVVQVSDSPAAAYSYPPPNGSRVAAAYIAAHSTQAEGVLADTVAVEFYTGRPVRSAPFTPSAIVLQSLDGTSADPISFVIVAHGPMHRNVDVFRDRWNTLLAEHFEFVPVGAPGLDVYRRRAHTVQ
jgi:hypothetical protein